MFKFTDENLSKYKEYLTRYDDVASALLPTLHLAQSQNRWLSDEVVLYISELMNIPVIKIKEVISFYDMLYDQPVGKHIVQVCTNISCSMQGSRELYQDLLTHYKVKNMENTADEKVFFQKMECLGACEKAPCMRLDNEYHQIVDLDFVVSKIDQLE